MGSLIPRDDDDEDTLLASCKPSSYYAARKNNGNLLMYPKSVLKQYDAQFAEGVDIEIAFNSDIKWDYDDNETTGILPGHYSLDFVAIQQILRGMGLMKTSRFYDLDFGFVGPRLLNTEGGYSYFEPPSVFDALIGNFTSAQYSELLHISSFPKQKMPMLEYWRIASNDLNIIRAGRRLYDLATNPGTNMYVSRFDTLVLNTSSVYTTKTLSYAADEVIDTADFIMSSPRKDFSIGMAMNHYQMEFEVFGPKIMSLMEWIGYCTNRQPFAPRFEVSRTFYSDEYDPNDSITVLAQ